MKTSRIILSAGLAVLASGCGGAESAAQDAVREALRDPDSAKFGEFTSGSDGEGEWACLTVNAKNSFGGYTGDQQARLRRNGSRDWEVMSIAEVSQDTCVSISKSSAAGSASPIAKSNSPHPSEPARSFRADSIPSNGQVVLSATEDVWMRISDGATSAPLFQGTLKQGESFRVPATARAPQLRTSRANVIRVTVGATTVPPLGPPERTISNVGLRPADIRSHFEAD